MPPSALSADLLSALAVVADISAASTLGLPSTRVTEFATLAWFVTIVLLNLVFTTLIVYILWPARRADHALGRRTTSVISIMAESAAAYSAMGILFIVVFATGSDYQIVLERVFAITAVR
jgi:hypothetical protein